MMFSLKRFLSRKVGFFKMKNMSNIVKIITKYKFLSLLILIFWICGIFFSLNLMNKAALKTPPHPGNLQRGGALPPSSSFKMAKTLHYCNPPTHIPKGLEGNNNDGTQHKLQAAVVVLRHGDRAPLFPVHNLSSVDCQAQNFPQLMDQLYQTAGKVSRHGNSPFKDFPLVPGPGCTISHLTPVGALQHLLLGMALKSAYPTLLPNSSLPRLFSTVYPRTFQSLMAFLHGLLPHADLGILSIQPVSEPRMCFDYCACPQARLLASKVDRKKRQLLESHPAVMQLLERLIPAVMATSLAPNGVVANAVLDGLLAYVCHGSPLPCPSEDLCVNYDHIRNLIAFVEWQGRQMSEDVTFKKLSLLYSYGLLNSIYDEIEEVLYNPESNPHRMIIYSAHDITLIPLANALGFYDGINPPYASRVVFEIYSNGSLASTAFKVLYNGKEVTKSIPFCKPSTPSPESLCPLEYLKRFVKVQILQLLNVESFSEACSLRD